MKIKFTLPPLGFKLTTSSLTSAGASCRPAAVPDIPGRAAGQRRATRCQAPFRRDAAFPPPLLSCPQRACALRRLRVTSSPCDGGSAGPRTCLLGDGSMRRPNILLTGEWRAAPTRAGMGRAGPHFRVHPQRGAVRAAWR